MFLIKTLLLNYLIIVVKVNTHYEEKAFCPKVDTNCDWIYPHYLTKDLKCTRNTQCLIGSLCCPDCHYQHKVCKIPIWLSKNKIKTECPKNPIIYCQKKFPYVGTKNFKCDTDDDCDHDSLCCSDDCYTHKICKKAAAKIEDIEENCPTDLQFCNYPLSYEETKKYKCIASKECQKGYLCCPDSCYTHKICKLEQLNHDELLCPISVKRELCMNKNRTFARYSCGNHDDCHSGYLCCQDNCYDHKVCKLSNEGFSYKSKYIKKDLNVTVLNLEDQQPRCPKIEEKCTKPHSLRLAKKFICFKDEDCKIGQLCCKDVCVKDFKICKNIFNLPSKSIKENSNFNNRRQDKEFYFNETDQFELVENEIEEGSGSGYTINDGEDD